MRRLERTYSGTERIVARARFSAWAFLREFFIAALLGGIIAVLWIFAPDIERLLDPGFSGQPAYLTPEVLKWAMLGAGCFVILLTVLHALSIYMQEIIITEDKFLYRSGVGSSVNVMLPLSEIRYIDVRQNLLQLLLGYGQIKPMQRRARKHPPAPATLPRQKALNAPCGTPPHTNGGTQGGIPQRHTRRHGRIRHDWTT